MIDLIVTALLVAVPVTAIGAVLSVIYLYRLYRESPPPRSWLFESLYRMDGVVAAIGLYYAYLVAARFIAQLPTMPSPWGSIVFGVTAIILVTPPITHALTIYRRRH